MKDRLWTGGSASQSSPRHRRHSKQSTKPDGLETLQPWTATRCHRLLRPLLTHIAALRKDKQQRALIHTSGVPGRTAKARSTVLGKRSYPGDDSDYSDKKTCRKYSRKASHRKLSGDQSCTPQRNMHIQRRQPSNKATHDVVLPTPFLRRVRNHQPSSPAQAPDEACHEEPGPARRCNHAVSGCKTKCAFEVELAGYRTAMDAERHSLYESVFKAFDYLLRATSPRRNQAAGPRSLLAMCLRKVPAYIAGLEEWERMEAEANGTKLAVQGAGVSFEIYSDLESLGAVDGWKHLCLLVRAHAVHIIQDAASEGLLTDPVTDLLIRLCLEYMPPTEFRGLIDTFVFRQYPRPQYPDDDLFTTPALRPLRVLKFCDPSGTSMMPRTLAELLADGLLPADWILHQDFISLWPSTVRDVTHVKKPCQDTVDFVVTTLELLCELASPRKPRGVPQTRLRGKSQTTLVSAVAALGSVVLLSEEGSSGNSEISSASRTAALRRRMSYIVTTCSSKLRGRKAGGRKLGTYLLALCSFLSLDDPFPSISSPASTLEASWKGVQHCRGNASLMLQYDATTALMSAIAYSCSRGTGLAPHVYLSQFCDKLETLDLPTGALSNMRVDGAFRLAEHTGDLRDLAFAEGLRERQAHAAAVCATPEQKTRSGGDKGRKKKAASFSGIRWDDGISEWVAATPGTELRPTGRRPGLRSRDMVDSEGEMGENGDVSEAEPETKPEDIEHGSPPADDESDGSASETDIETETDETQSPNTEASPLPSDPDHDPEPKLERASEGHPHPEDSHPSSPRSTKADQSPPPPAGGFLTARPRRLSRPITRAGDELAFDDEQSNRVNKGISLGEANWLCRKKPSRFRRDTATARKRVARASLVYVQPIERSRPDHGSDDELSFL